MHSYRATTMMMECMSSDETYSDGFVGAVLTMALSERLKRNDAAWEVHMNGLIRIIEARKARWLESLPTLFYNLMIL